MSNQQLIFQFVNYGADPNGVANVIYITSNQSYNKLDWQILLNTGSVSLKPAPAILDPTQLPPVGDNGTLIYLSLQPLGISDAIFKQLVFSADGWSFKLFLDEQMVGMTPTQNIPMNSGNAGMQAIRVANMEITQAPQSTVDLSTQIYDSQFANIYGNFKVALQAAPDQHDKNLQDYIQAQLSNASIINSYQSEPTKNSTQLAFAAGMQSAQIAAGPQSAFNISFVYGQPNDKYGYGALTTIDLAQNIRVTRQSNADAWQIVPNISAQNVSWDLIPPKGKPIIGSGVAAIVSFDLDQIVTLYQPGPTVMLVSYQNIPGYQDGVYTLILNKIPHVIIDSIEVTPNPAYFQNVGGQEQASAVVQWSTRYSTSLQLMQNFNSIPLQQDQTRQAVTLTTDPTNFTLTAYGQGGLANVDSRNFAAVVLPVINSFAGAPTEIFAGQQSQPVTLSWAVDTPGQVSISSSADPTHSQTYSAQNNVTETATQPQMFTLTPVTQENVLTLTRNLVISAFNLSPQNYPMPGIRAGGVSASPTAPFAAFTNPLTNQVTIVDTVQYSQMTTVGVGQEPAAIIFSQDGTLMITANTGDNTVSIVQVSIENGAPNFGSPSNVSVSGKPGQIFITPDNSHIYVAVDPGGTQAGQLVVLKGSNGSYALDTQISVGKAPYGLAVLPSGARIYVANTADNTISIVGAQGEMFTVTGTISVQGEPMGLAMTPNGNLLLAACSSSNNVYVINTNTASSQTLTVGKQPAQIAVTPSGAYAFVTNEGDGTLSLINCRGTQPSQTSVLGQPIRVGNSPLNVVVTPDGLGVLIANNGGLNVVTLQIYGAAQVISSVANQPTNVVADPDGSSALVWHNAMINIEDSGQPTGAVCYAITSGTLTEVLGEVPITQCVFHPDPSKHQAFAVATNGPGLYIINTTNPTSPTFTQQQIQGASFPVAIAISGDGQTLFVISASKSLQYTLLVLGYDGKAASWTTQQSLQLYQGQTPGVVLIEATPDASTVLVIDGANNVFKAITWRSSKQQYRVADTSVQITNPVAMTILPDGSKAYVVGQGTPSNITVIDLSTLQGEMLSLIERYVNLQGLVSAPDGRRLYGTDLSAGAMRVFDPASLRILQTLPLASNISQQAQGASGITIAPDASHIFAVSTESGTMSVFQQVPMN